ncbi:unnamed protein product [Urochloa decumbens]|uniref:BHLH domain-containing protein n=1 Tax=Urochloa decumbens TaxID=240449 RepID=A0ABC9DPX8_9POAL
MAMVREPTAPSLCFDEALIHDFSYSQQLLEECMGGCDPWELPMAGVSSSSPSSSSVVSFDGHGEDYFASNSFSFGGDSGGGAGHVTAAVASQKWSRARAPSQGSEEEEDVAALQKKQCGRNRRAATKPNKATTETAPKDPQNLAAKNRRERISERLRVLQELVPNGSKVDTVAMLDKAITYVRFMQLQLKVLETDAFWPTPDGEAPKMSQVKEALDAILLSAPVSRSNPGTQRFS